MTPQTRTVAFLLLLGLEVLAYELWVLFAYGREATITLVFRSWDRECPWVSLVVGMALVYLAWHLFRERL